MVIRARETQRMLERGHTNYVVNPATEFKSYLKKEDGLIFFANRELIPITRLAVAATNSSHECTQFCSSEGCGTGEVITTITGNEMQEVISGFCSIQVMKSLIINMLFLTSINGIWCNQDSQTGKFLGTVRSGKPNRYTDYVSVAVNEQRIRELIDWSETDWKERYQYDLDSDAMNFGDESDPDPKIFNRRVSLRNPGEETKCRFELDNGRAEAHLCARGCTNGVIDYSLRFCCWEVADDFIRQLPLTKQASFYRLLAAPNCQALVNERQLIAAKVQEVLEVKEYVYRNVNRPMSQQMYTKMVTCFVLLCNLIGYAGAQATAYTGAQESDYSNSISTNNYTRFTEGLIIPVTVSSIFLAIVIVILGSWMWAAYIIVQMWCAKKIHSVFSNSLRWIAVHCMWLTYLLPSLVVDVVFGRLFKTPGVGFIASAGDPVTVVYASVRPVPESAIAGTHKLQVTNPSAVPESALLISATTAGDYSTAYILGQGTRVKTINNKTGMLTALHNWTEIAQMSDFSIVSMKKAMEGKFVHAIVRPDECKATLKSATDDIVIVELPEVLWSVIGAKAATVGKPSPHVTTMLVTAETKGFSVQFARLQPLKKGVSWCWHLASTSHRNSGAGFYKSGQQNTVVGVHVAGGPVERDPNSKNFGCAKENYATGLNMLATIIQDKKPTPEITPPRKDVQPWVMSDTKWEEGAGEGYDTDWSNDEEVYEDGEMHYVKSNRSDDEFEHGKVQVHRMDQDQYTDYTNWEKNKRVLNQVIWADDDPFYERLDAEGETLTVGTNLSLNQKRVPRVASSGSTNSEVTTGNTAAKKEAGIDQSARQSLDSTKEPEGKVPSQSAKQSNSLARTEIQNTSGQIEGRPQKERALPTKPAKEPEPKSTKSKPNSEKIPETTSKGDTKKVDPEVWELMTKQEKDDFIQRRRAANKAKLPQKESAKEAEETEEKERAPMSSIAKADESLKERKPVRTNVINAQKEPVEFLPVISKLSDSTLLSTLILLVDQLKQRSGQESSSSTSGIQKEADQLASEQKGSSDPSKKSE